MGRYTQNTWGNWGTEPEACTDFDQVVGESGLFSQSYEEVWGQYLLAPIQTEAAENKKPRIDRILWPGEKLISAGWDQGPIGVEIKRSGKPVGPVISQVLDYTRASWHLGDGVWINTIWNFLFPFDPLNGGDIGSVMQQNRIGGIRLHWHKAAGTRKSLVFLVGTTVAISWHSDRPDDVKVNVPRCGQKVGSR